MRAEGGSAGGRPGAGRHSDAARGSWLKVVRQRLLI